ncbi:hypothetical protein RvY_04932-2 [Ramazzottius varieornatus]|nr:hypothetical protein RvY_04932-2 [Ramazzottius varieornatus]
MQERLVHNPKTEKNEVLKVVESVCSKPCRRGEVKAIQTGGVKCCWVCTACKLNEFLLDEFTCEACPPGWLPNENLTACLPITLEYASLDSGSVGTVVAICFSCLGFLATGFTMTIFILHNNTTVVKASTRELSYMILVGIFLCYATAFPLFAKPTKFSCYLTRILPGFSFAIIYGALLTKTNRIARILAAGKKKIMTRKPRFMSALAQVVITWIIIGVEVAILSASLIHEPADSILYYPEVNRARLICNTSAWGIIAPMGFELFLIAMCTVYAIKTRNLPENFNEAKFIGFTMYTTCVVWIAFFPIYFGSDAKVLTMTLCISFSATVALCLLFFPKLYIILFRPERNNRSAFTTTNQVRCHIGSNNVNNKSLDSNSAERPHALFRRQRIPTERSASLTRTETLLQRFSIRRPKRLSEASVRNSLSFDSPSASFSQENHVENHRQVYSNLKLTAPSRRVTRMSDVMEETSTAFGRDDTTENPSHVSRLDAGCQTGNELLQALVDQIIPTPTLRRRRRSLLMMCNEIEEELLSPSTMSNSNWHSSDAKSVASQIDSVTSPSKHSLSSSRQIPDNISNAGTLNRIESASSLGVAATPDNITLTSSRVSLASLASSIQLLNQLNDANMDSESLRNLRDWLAEQGILLTDLQTSTL